MKDVMARPVTRVWLALVVITCITTWGLTESFVPAVVGTVGVMVLAASKVGLIAWNFMGVRCAPAPWQVYFAGWVVVTTVLVLAFYLVT